MPEDPTAKIAIATILTTRESSEEDRKEATKATATKHAAFASTDMSRAYVNTWSNKGNAEIFMKLEVASTRQSAAVARQNTAS